MDDRRPANVFRASPFDPDRAGMSAYTRILSLRCSQPCVRWVVGFFRFASADLDTFQIRNMAGDDQEMITATARIVNHARSRHHAHVIDATIAND